MMQVTLKKLPEVPTDTGGNTNTGGNNNTGGDGTINGTVTIEKGNSCWLDLCFE